MNYKIIKLIMWIIMQIIRIMYKGANTGIYPGGGFNLFYIPGRGAAQPLLAIQFDTFYFLRGP